MAQPPADSSLPRHLHPPATTQAGASSSPTTPPPPRSPALVSPSLPSPSPSTNGPPLPSPNASNSNTNRFGLALGSLIQRRPRGNTNPSSMTGARSPGQGGGSPSSELPPSPGGGDRGGYGFPALRRTLSKRAGSGAVSPNGNGGAAGGSGARARRSSSQPPQPVGMHSEGSEQGTGRPRTATADSSAGGLGLDVPAVASPTVEHQPPTPAADPTATYRLRLVPHLESIRSLHFEPVDRSVTAFQILKVGRFTDRSHGHGQGTQDATRIAFKSKVVSRGHAEIWADEAGKFHIRDTKSSSGTFLNHIRLSGPNSESRAFPLKDGDVLQLGVDYQGGTEEIYRCVKMRVELNRGWQRGGNAFKFVVSFSLFLPPSSLTSLLLPPLPLMCSRIAPPL